jgi:p-hydroxybenzoate 3-monooxygenase
MNRHSRPKFHGPGPAPGHLAHADLSSWFLRILLASLRDGQEPGPAVPGGFARGLRDGWVHALQHDQLLARWFAHAYAGVDQEEPA